MFTILWTVIVLGSIGTVTTFQETVGKPSYEECMERGKAIEPRMKDYFRGALNIQIDEPIVYSFSCIQKAEEEKPKMPETKA